jgi:hypothetical protein
MAGVLMLFVAVGLVALLVYVMGRKDRYTEMTEQEFEEEARKKSFLGAAIMGLEGSLRKREATIMMEAKSRVERDATPTPGEPPEEGGDFHSKKEGG